MSSVLAGLPLALSRFYSDPSWNFHSSAFAPAIRERAGSGQAYAESAHCLRYAGYPAPSANERHQRRISGYHGMRPRSMTVLAGLLDTTNEPRRAPAILDNTKFIATSQIPNNLTVGSSSDCSEIYLGDFSKFIYFMREGVSIQLLKETFGGTGEIGFMCHTRVDAAATYPAALSVVTGVRP